jgi:hypothetical protein
MYLLTQVVLIILVLLLLYIVREMDDKIDWLTAAVEEIKDSSDAQE